MIRIVLILVFYCFVSNSVNSQNRTSIDDSRFKQADLLWDLKALSEAPSFRWVDSASTVGSLIYESLPFEEKPTQVFAYYSNPDLLQGIRTGKTFPGVVLIHGGGGTAFKEWVEKWAADGYAAIAMDLNGKGEGGKPLGNPGPVMDQKFRFTNIDTGKLKDMWTYHAVARAIQAHSFLLNRTEVNSDKTCLTGISWGGYLTCLVASIDDRFQAAAPVYGCGFYDESDAFGKEFLKMTPAGRDKWMNYFDPSSYLPFAVRPLLFVNGNVDFFYNVVPYSKCYELVNGKKNISFRPNMKHGHVDGWQPVEIRYFFESIINQGVALPEIEPITRNDSTIEAKFAATVGLRSASFHYSSDTTSTNEKRVWSEVKAKVDPINKKISCKAPVGNFKYAIFYATDHREVSVSSPIFIK